MDCRQVRQMDYRHCREAGPDIRSPPSAQPTHHYAGEQQRGLQAQEASANCSAAEANSAQRKLG